MNKRVAAALLTVGAVGAAVGLIIVLSDDEAPIRVRNGSMEIQAGQDPDNEFAWELEPNGDNVDPTPSYSHEPRDHYIDLSKDLWVRVVRRTGTCASGDKATGRNVRIEFSENNFAATFKRGKSGTVNYRTKARPSGDLTPDTTQRPPVLRYGTTGSGFITSVRVNNWSCTFENANVLDVIYICSSENSQECQ